MSKQPPSKAILSRGTWTLVRRLAHEHIRPYVGVIAFSLFCMAIAAAATAAMAKLMEPMLDDIFKDRNYDALHVIAGLTLAVFMAKGLATYGQSVSMNYVGQRIIADVQKRLFGHLISADLAFFHNRPTGDLISRFVHDVTLLRNAVSTTLTGMGKDFLTVAFLVGVMFYQDWLLALIAFFVFPTAIVPIVRIGRRMRKVSTNTQTEMAHLTTVLEESFQGVRHVKAYGMEAYESERASSLIDRVANLLYKAAKTRSISHPIMETLGGVAIVTVLFYGGYQVLTEARTPGAFFSFITALLLAYEPVKKLANLNANLQEGLAAADRVFALLDAPPLIVDQPGAAELAVPRGGIRLDNVYFSYAEDVPALKGATLDVPAGKTVALVGPSGAGKSTILNLIPRFYDVRAGSVTIDGTDVRTVTLASLRAKIGLVSQESSLFDDTVRANIAYGRPEAGEAEIIAAAKHAAAHGFITRLPQGYDTRVGGQGVKLSGGQRQRLAIARAMLKNAPILLLDEATSALDTESERQVQTALTELMQGRTTLVIAHRLSTVVDADLIYVIEDGEVRESGTHRELLARNDAYARLYRLQLANGGENPADLPPPAPARRARA